MGLETHVAAGAGVSAGDGLHGRVRPRGCAPAVVVGMDPLEAVVGRDGGVAHPDLDLLHAVLVAGPFEEHDPDDVLHFIFRMSVSSSGANYRGSLNQR